MRELALPWACLACTCHAWRVESSSRQLTRDHLAARQTQPESKEVRQSSSLAHARDILNQPEVFMMFLLALNPRAAFSHSGPRAHVLLDATSSLPRSKVASDGVRRRCCFPFMASWNLQEQGSLPGFPGDKVPTIVNGYEVVPRPSEFPDSLEAPSMYESIKRLPLPSVLSTFYAPLQGDDLIAAILVGIALMFGPDFFLFPAGLASGLRPGFELESVIGELVTPDDQWLKDRKEGLKAEVPLKVRVLVLLPFLAAGLLVSRVLLIALEDPSFVTSLGIIGCGGGGLLEIIREPVPTREERDRTDKLLLEFNDFAIERLKIGGRCSEADVVEAFRRFYPRYRWSDMGSTTDGVSLKDQEIQQLLRRWNKQMGYPGARTQAGVYWNGFSLEPMKGQEDGVSKTWFYRDRGAEYSYILRKLDPQTYLFEQTISKTFITGRLSQNGEWYEGPLSNQGTIRVRLVDGRMISNFRPAGSESWNAAISSFSKDRKRLI